LPKSPGSDGDVPSGGRRGRAVPGARAPQAGSRPAGHGAGDEGAGQEPPRADRLAELHARRGAVLAGGGPERVARQRAQGKRTARERLALLFDPGSFTELGMHVRHRAVDFDMAGREIPGDAVVTGFGRVDGRTVFAFSQDFTAAGGTLGEMHARKIVQLQELAVRTGAPLVGINDSGGARIQEGVDALDGFARIFRGNVAASGVVPQISVVVGPSAGGAVYSPALTDFVFMVRGISYMYITGPDVVRAVLRQQVDHATLGGGEVHADRSGVCHFLEEDEAACFATVRRLLGYLPANNLEDPPVLEGAPPPAEAPELRGAVPEDPAHGYDVHRVIEGIVDAGSFLEVHAGWARSAVVGFARLAGRPLGVVANQPAHLAGCLDIDSSDKIARFVRTCDAFNVPLVTLVDTPGYLPGTDQEHRGIIRHGAKVLYAYAEATVPKVSLVLRKAYGGAYIAMCARGLGADLAAAWPGAEIAVMGAEGACNIIFRAEMEAAADPEAVRRARVAEYRAAFAHPYVAAARQYVDAVLDPAETRLWLHEAFLMLRAKRQEAPARKHGNEPA
jgi:acetyl-CoA carboxylase carboxyltransferase component